MLASKEGLAFTKRLDRRNAQRATAAWLTRLTAASLLGGEAELADWSIRWLVSDRRRLLLGSADYSVSDEEPARALLKRFGGLCDSGTFSDLERVLLQHRIDREKKTAEEVLEFLRLTDLADELAGNLSGGQKKLLELGRAMMAEPKIVLLDEPGAGVNPTLLGNLADMIERLNRERSYTFCIIEHNMDMIARLCEPVIVMAEGSVLTQGSMEAVRTDARVLDAYLGGDDTPEIN